MICTSTRDGEVCIREAPHRELDQHRSLSGRRWYYGDDIQKGMPRRYIYDHIPLVVLIEEDLKLRKKA